MIVKVGFRFGHVKTPSENGRGKIFRARFAIAPGDRQDTKRQRFPVVRGQVLVGLQSVFDANDRDALRSFPAPPKIDNHAGGAGFVGGCDEFVSIEIFAAQSDKQFASLQGA